MTLSNAYDEVAPPRPRPPQRPAVRRALPLAIVAVAGEPAAASGWTDRMAALCEALGDAAVLLDPEKARPHGLRDQWLQAAGLGGPSRQAAVQQMVERLQVRHVIHAGPAHLAALPRARGLRHILYCDSTADLALNNPLTRRNRVRLHRQQSRERQAFAAAEHIFTLGGHVRDNLVARYGIPAGRVTAVGSGMRPLRRDRPQREPTQRPFLLFAARHGFTEKGGQLALKAFRLARRRRPDLRLVVVGNDRWRSTIGHEPGVLALGHVPDDTLEQLMRSAALLLQPMPNAPWGQVYLEAMACRTPVVGLDRNSLPEITENGRHGFMVSAPDPMLLAETVVDALADPARLARMSEAGQRSVLRRYSWDRVARTIAETLAER